MGPKKASCLFMAGLTNRHQLQRVIWVIKYISFYNILYVWYYIYRNITYLYIYHSWICKAPKLHETWYCLLGATIGFRWILEDINGLSKSTLGGGFNGILVQQNFRDLPYLSICWKTKSEPTLQHLQIYVPSGKLYNIAMEYHYFFYRQIIYKWPCSRIQEL